MNAQAIGRQISSDLQWMRDLHKENARLMEECAQLWSDVHQLLEKSRELWEQSLKLQDRCAEWPSTASPSRGPLQQAKLFGHVEGEPASLRQAVQQWVQLNKRTKTAIGGWFRLWLV
jgi:hypothetical protein